VSAKTLDAEGRIVPQSDGLDGVRLRHWLRERFKSYQSEWWPPSGKHFGQDLSPSRHWAAAIIAAATGGLLPLGLLAAFSIGLPLLIAGVLTAIAWGQAVDSGRPTSAALPAVLAVFTSGLLIVGILLT
jgi:hypothetical protein